MYVTFLCFTCLLLCFCCKSRLCSPCCGARPSNSSSNSVVSSLRRELCHCQVCVTIIGCQSILEVLIVGRRNRSFSQRNSLSKNIHTQNGVYVNKHNAELQRTDPGTKVTGEFSTKDCIFSPNAQNGFLLCPSFQLGKIH